MIHAHILVHVSEYRWQHQKSVELGNDIYRPAYNSFTFVDAAICFQKAMLYNLIHQTYFDNALCYPTFHSIKQNFCNILYICYSKHFISFTKLHTKSSSLCILFLIKISKMIFLLIFIRKNFW